MTNKISNLWLDAAIILFAVSLCLIFIRHRSELQELVLDGLAKVIFKQRIVYYKGPFLRKELGEVEKVKVIYYRGNYPGGGNTTILTSEKDKDLISELYKKIAATKLVIYANPDEFDRQESDPLFEIIFVYKNGKSDIIESTETGRYIFRRLFRSGWLGGPCDDILAVIKKMVARNN